MLRCGRSGNTVYPATCGVLRIAASTSGMRASSRGLLSGSGLRHTVAAGTRDADVGSIPTAARIVNPKAAPRPSLAGDQQPDSIACDRGRIQLPCHTGQCCGAAYGVKQGQIASPEAPADAAGDLGDPRSRCCPGLLGHTKLESTVCSLGIEADDALQIARQTEL